MDVLKAAMTEYKETERHLRVEKSTENIPMYVSSTAVKVSIVALQMVILENFFGTPNYNCSLTSLQKYP